jgi:hypothetical protein
MKRLFLLFILLPVISLGQTRQDAIVDSIKAAATSLHNIAAYINNHPDSKVEHINASDSGAYVTVTVRIHVPESVIIPTLLPQGVAAIRISPSIPDRPATVTVPTLPPPIIEADTILPLPVPVVAELMTGDTHILNLSAMEVPSLPDAAPEPEELPLPTLTECKIAAIVAWKTGTVTAPQQPDIKSDIIEPLLPSTAVSFSIEHPRISDKVYMTIVPVFEENRMPVDEMHLSDEGYSLLEKLEGFSSELYSLKDGGFTIGFGFFVPFEEGKKWSKGVTWERAEVIIRQKVPAYEDQVKQYINVPTTWEDFQKPPAL